MGDSQLRWIGPEKGVIHLATAAVVNAVWDLFAKHEGKPLWKLLCDMSPEQLVALVDFRYISDALTPERALERLRASSPTRASARRSCSATAIRRTTTSIGWLGYDDDKIRGCVARRWPKGGPPSSSRSAPTSTTTDAAPHRP